MLHLLHRLHLSHLFTFGTPVTQEDRDELPSGFLQYMAAFYWATMMTTGLNVAIGPGEREGPILYEVFVTFLGICMQARYHRTMPATCTSGCASQAFMLIYTCCTC